MTKWIIHSIIFIFVVSIVLSSLIGGSDGDDVKAVTQLPALLLAGIYVGVLFVLYILPAITDKATSAVLDSNELVETDPMHDARAAHARGDYDEAIAVYREVADTDPYNRLPWVEIAKIHTISWKIRKHPSQPCVQLSKATSGPLMMRHILWVASRRFTTKI